MEDLAALAAASTMVLAALAAASIMVSAALAVSMAVQGSIMAGTTIIVAGVGDWERRGSHLVLQRSYAT